MLVVSTITAPWLKVKHSGPDIKDVNRKKFGTMDSSLSTGITQGTVCGFLPMFVNLFLIMVAFPCL